MENIYIKTTWIDNKTPVNAANLNKIENAISDLYQRALSASSIQAGNGISVNTSCNGSIELSVSDNVMLSDSCPGVEVVFGEVPTTFYKDKLYLVMNEQTRRLIRLEINGISIYEVE